MNLKKAAAAVLACLTSVASFSQVITSEQTNNSAPTFYEMANEQPMPVQPVQIALPSVNVPQPPQVPPSMTSIYSNYSELPQPLQQSVPGASQQILPQYEPYTPPPYAEQQPAQYPQQLPAPQQPYAPQPYAEQPSMQYPQQLPVPEQQFYYAPQPSAAPHEFPPPAYGVKTYRLQVGAFKSIIHAQNVYDAVSAVGLSPAIETTEDLYRVVIPYVPALNVNECAELLRQAGFSVWVREE
jgi:cell division protein FtsN